MTFTKIRTGQDDNALVAADSQKRPPGVIAAGGLIYEEPGPNMTTGALALCLQPL